MAKKVSSKLTTLTYPTNCNVSHVESIRTLILIILIIFIIRLLIGGNNTIILIDIILAFFVIIHIILKLSAIFKPWSKTYVNPDHKYKPFVSIHIACKNEPAETVIKTVKALTKLNYPNYEVIVINNNNHDKQNWSKIQRYINKCGKNFKFIHLDKIDGFKSGALNYLNNYIIDKRTDIEAIVDCDYIVIPDFLNETVGYFKDPRIGIVQAPQDYYNVNQFNIGLFYEYRSFFEIVMHQAQQLNLVTFTGTMGLIRADLLKKGLKWNEWCITEDVEAGTHINSLGYKGVYVDKSLGKGLMPFDYASLIKQRQRWTYGNMQIIRKDFFHVIANQSLSIKQKIAFFAQLATWFHFELILAFIYLIINTLQFFGYSGSNILFTNNLMLALLLFSLASNFIYFLIGMRKRTSVFNNIKAFLIHYGLLYVMSFSWITCLLGRKLGFIVTKKERTQNNIPFRQYSKEFTIVVMLFVGLILRYFNNENIKLDLLVIIIFSSIELFGIFYLRRSFIKPIEESSTK